MPTIYHWQTPHNIADQDRATELLSRYGWFETPTKPVSLNKKQAAVRDSQGFSVPSDWGKYWFPALARASKGEGKAQVAWLGSSTMQGYYATDLDATSAFALVRDAVQEYGGNGGSGFQGMQFSDTFLSGAPSGAYNLYKSKGNAWNQVAGSGSISTPTFQLGPSEGYLSMSGGAYAEITFTGRRLAIWFFNNHSASPFTYAVDGGSAITITPGAGLGADLATTRVLSPTDYGTGEHTVRITSGTNAMRLIGIDAENDDGVVFNNYAIAGMQSDKYSNNDSFQSGTYMGGHRFRDTNGVTPTSETPDLLIISVPPNDAIKTSESLTMTTNGTDTVTSSSWRRYHVGRTVSGTGIPAGTTVVSVSEATSAVLSAAATDSTTGSRTVTNPTAADRFVKHWEQYLAGVLDNVYGGGTLVSGETDILIIDPMMKITSDTTKPTWRVIQQRARALADVYGAAYLNTGGSIGQSWSAFYKLGYMGKDSDPELFDGSDPSNLGDDAVHMSDKGHAYLADNILRVILR